jgi:hypothetical protein
MSDTLENKKQKPTHTSSLNMKDNYPSFLVGSTKPQGFAIKLSVDDITKGLKLPQSEKSYTSFD